MSEQMRPKTPDALDRALDEWKVGEPLPPRFQEQVWRRIAQEQSSPSGWQFVLGWLNELLARRTVAASYLVILVISGVVLGSWTAQLERNRLDAAMGSSYVRSIDPALHVSRSTP